MINLNYSILVTHHFDLIMFNSIFSFKGRIRRLEFGLTLVFYFVGLILSGLFLGTIPLFESVFYLYIFFAYWVLLAQGAKRCHDIGNSGFYQLIPFYVLVMIFAEGEKKNNRYGEDPKQKLLKTPSAKSSPEKLNKPTSLLIMEIITATMIAVFITGVINILFIDYENFQILFYFITAILGFYILLIFSYNKNSLDSNRSLLINQQLIFSPVYYIVIRLYNIVFRGAEFDILTAVYEIFVVAFIFGLTYLSIGLYKLTFKPQSKHV